MAMLRLVIVVAILAGIAQGIRVFSHRCQRRFGFSFFTVRGFYLAALAINFLWWGYYASATATLHHGQVAGGLVLMAAGVAATVWLIYENVRETDFLHGVSGSSLQLVLFFPIALYGVPLLAIALAFLLFATYKGAPAWLVDP